jgi:signal transduction histidine kinase
MLALPAPVRDFLPANIQKTRSPAYLVVDKRGRLRAWGGNLFTYGIAHPRKGTPVTRSVYFLEGLLPLDDSPLYLPCVETASGIFADIHIFPGDERDWVLLLDATDDEVQRRILQQKANEFSLLQERQAKMVGHYAGTEAATNPMPVVHAVLTNIALMEDLLQALDIVVLERLPDGAFRIVGAIPEWFRGFFPGATVGQESVRPGCLFPFLENFLIDAEQFWHGHANGQVKSGVWIEIDPSGHEYSLEASAICLGSQKLLLIVLPKSEYEEKHAIIQRAREHSIANDLIDKEIQKREVLLHCIVHDLAGPLTSIMLCLSLLKSENLSVGGRKYVDLSMRQATKQDRLIRQMLDIFAAELGALQAYTTDPAQAPDAVACAREVIEAFMPDCAPKAMRLVLDSNIDVTGDWKVVGEKSRLDRVMVNLVENALRYGPSGSVVTIGVRHDGEYVLMTVDDEGPGIPPDLAGKLFDKFSQGRERGGKAGLGLFFCRIVVEHWGGSIGYSRRPEGGSRFWFRLARPVQP